MACQHVGEEITKLVLTCNPHITNLRCPDGYDCQHEVVNHLLFLTGDSSSWSLYVSHLLLFCELGISSLLMISEF